MTLAVAAARPHDLYFYADPLDMMEGNVQPPKIFLKASAVLERQFVAYCMDSWVKRGVPDICLPVARRGCHGLYIELKRVKGSHISREQLQWMDALARQGYQCAICKGWEMARDVIVDYLQGKGDTP